MTENKRLFVGRKKVEDRFTIILDYDDEIGVKENRSGDVIVLKHNDLNAQQFVAQLVVFLNDQNQAIVDLYDGCKYWSDKASERIKELEKENEQLKKSSERYKQLSEIREKEINNRILTIKEFIDNTDGEIKKALKELFYSEVKEYDVSDRLRELKKENKELMKNKKVRK